MINLAVAKDQAPFPDPSLSSPGKFGDFIDFLNPLAVYMAFRQ